MATSAAAAARSWLGRIEGTGITRGVLALCLLWVVTVGPIVSDLSAQPAPRVALTGALVDDHDIKIDGYKLGVDSTERDGHVYSDKALGQELLAVPVYVAARMAGAEPARVARAEANLTLWWVTLWSAGLPALAVICMVAVAGHRRGTPVPTPALATLAFGTMLLPFSANLYGHVLGGALGFAAWLVLDQAPPRWSRGAIAGGLASVAVVVEYQLAIVGVVLAAALLVRRHWTSLAGYLVAGLPSAVLVAVYHAAAFGSPFASGYGDKQEHEGASLLVTGLPRPTTMAAMLFGSRGLLIFTPVVAVGVVGLVLRWRRTRDEAAMVALAVVAGFVLLQAGWQNPWGGDGPGPRYVIPMLPFLGLGLGWAWPRTPALVRRWVAGVSVVSMVSATVTYHLLSEGQLVLVGHIQTLATEGPNPTVWSIALGPLGWVIYALSVAGAAWIYLRATARADVAVPVDAGALSPV